MFALQVLATRDEDQGLLHRFVVRSGPGGAEGIDQKLRVRQVGPLVLSVAGAAVGGIGLVHPFALGPLVLLEKPLGIRDQLVVSSVAVGLDKTDQRQAGFIISIEAFFQGDGAVGLHEAFEILQALGHQRVLRRAAVAEHRGGDHGGHARPGEFRIRAVGGLGLVLQKVDGSIHRLGVSGGVGRNRLLCRQDRSERQHERHHETYG